MSAPVYAWSRDGEEFHGEFDSREAALLDAMADADDEHEPGDSVTLYTGRQQLAITFLRPLEARVGERVTEMLDDWLADEIPADSEIAELIKEKHAAFGKHILDWFETHGSFSRWAVVDIVQHPYVVPAES
jgi:hypothetical protein